jgi:hypothetical protein
VANGQKYTPATEGEQKFYGVVDKGTLEQARIDHPGYTTCVDFAQRMIAFATMDKKGQNFISVWGPSANVSKKKAWVAASPGMDRSIRPSPGDLCVLHKPDKPDDFQHCFIIDAVQQPTTGGDEVWSSFDGGQGKAPQEQFLAKTRSYSPDTNTLSGSPVFGWVDVDLLRK